MNYLAIFIGGGLGSLLRYLTTIFFKKYSFFNLPIGTLVSNVVASFLLGIFVSYFVSRNIDNKVLANFLIVGLCGGFSTFSTFALENYRFISNNQIPTFFLYMALSIVVSLLFIYLGFVVSNFSMNN